MNNAENPTMVPIKGYEGLYSITNTGEVYSERSKKWLSLPIANGYRVVNLSFKGKMERFAIHRLVALHFVEGYEEGLVVNHKDGNKLNNHHTNLEWCTHQQNCQHAWATGLCYGHDKLTKDTWKLDPYKLLSPQGEIHEGFGLKAFCDSHGIQVYQTREVLRGNTHKHRGWSAVDTTWKRKKGSGRPRMPLTRRVANKVSRVALSNFQVKMNKLSLHAI